MVVTLLMLAASIACPVFANDYPNKPIKIISDSAPGSAVDVTFRMVMDRLGIVLGQLSRVPVEQLRRMPHPNRSLTDIRCSRRKPTICRSSSALSLFISLPGIYMREPAIRHQNAAGPRQR